MDTVDESELREYLESLTSLAIKSPKFYIIVARQDEFNENLEPVVVLQDGYNKADILDSVLTAVENIELI